ncbi:MAG: hypothetical protein IJX13_05130, partial [Clostridia bacterium]|nr:hypothetical protein [Clostridia bacterium]
ALFLSANAALADQVADRTMGEHVVAELMDIFDLTEEDLPEADEDSSDSSEGENDKKDEEIVGEGGIGTGEMLFGSDDTVYDPDGHTHVKYGDVIFDYYALVLDAIQNGDLSEEWKQYIGDYFAALLGSANAPGNTNGNTENNDG